MCVMSSSLETMRDENRDGDSENSCFRQSNDYPLVLVFDSKYSEDKLSDKISWREPIIASHTPSSEEGKIVA